MQNAIRTGIAGFGKQGSHYARMFFEDRVCPQLKLTAIADSNPVRLQWARDHAPQGTLFFDSAEAMLSSGAVDACIIATPHAMHPQHTIYALQHGVHVMCDKPAGVNSIQVQQMNEEADKHPDLVFSIMFNQRTNCAYRKLREIVQGKTYGNVRRIEWTINNWFRSQLYYDSSDWRGVWKGAYGGTIIDQCPHQVDLWQWIFGMPDKVTCRMGFGIHHDIEVEDEVAAIMEYNSGVMGILNVSTSVPNGTNVLQVHMDGANITVKGNSVFVERFTHSVQEWEKEPHGLFDKPSVEPVEELKTDGQNLQHKGVLQAWANAILGKGKCVAGGKEGINCVILSDAMYLSAFKGQTVSLPFDGQIYLKELNARAATSKKKKPAQDPLAPINETFAVKDPKKMDLYFGIKTN